MSYVSLRTDRGRRPAARRCAVAALMAGLLAGGVAGCGGGSGGGGPGSVDFSKAKSAAETNPAIAKRAARLGGGQGGAPSRGAR